MDIFAQLVKMLIKKNYSITAAESCTAGMFCSRVADIPGASEALAYGFVVYSEEAKHRMLGVSPKTIAEYGVVSEPTAREMAIGAAEKAHADVSVSFTGYAGPASCVTDHVGRVCFGYSIKGNVQTQTVEFGDIGRNNVREKSAAHAAKRLLELLEAEA